MSDIHLPSGTFTPDVPEGGCLATLGALGFAIILVIVILGMIVDGVTNLWHKATHTVAPSSSAISGQLRLEGIAQYSIDIDKGTVSIKLDKICATSSYGHSGSLQLVLWAEDKCCFEGGTISGMRLASWDLDELDAGWFYHDIERAADFDGGVQLVRERPYYITLTLLEYDRGQRWITHWVSFKEPYMAAPKKPWWKFWAAEPDRSGEKSGVGRATITEAHYPEPFTPPSSQPTVDGTGNVPEPSAPAPEPGDVGKLRAPATEVPSSPGVSAERRSVGLASPTPFRAAPPGALDSPPSPSSRFPMVAPGRPVATPAPPSSLSGVRVRIIWADPRGLDARRLNARLRNLGPVLSYERPSNYRLARSTGIYAPAFQRSRADVVAREVAAVLQLPVYLENTRDGAIEIVLTGRPAP